jgi:hypothetical protein
MRRSILSIAAVSVLAMTVGCVHTAGVCDCDRPSFPNGVVNGTKAEPIKEMPKVTAKEAAKEKVELDTSEPPPAQ